MQSLFSFDFKHKNSPMLVYVVSVTGLEALVVSVVVSHADAITIGGRAQLFVSHIWTSKLLIRFQYELLHCRDGSITL
ncbi:hypothetical protein ACE6H2_026727 [Prunus campanulata]